MDLGVNVVRLTRQFTGVGRYIECVLAEWSRMDLPFDEVILYAHSYDTIAERHPQLIFSSRTSRCLWSLKAWSAQRQADLIRDSVRFRSQLSREAMESQPGEGAGDPGGRRSHFQT